MPYELSGCGAICADLDFLDGEYTMNGGFFCHVESRGIFLYFEKHRWWIGNGDVCWARSEAGVSCHVPPFTGWSLWGVGRFWIVSKCWSPQEHVRLSPIRSRACELIEAYRLRVEELRTRALEFEALKRSSALTIDNLKREVASSNEACQRARDDLMSRDIELDQVQNQLRKCELRLGEVLKARGLHDTRSTLDSQFPHALEILRDVKVEVVEQSLQNLVQCLRLEKCAKPSSILLLLSSLFSTCVSYVDDRFRSFDLRALIDESSTQHETLEFALLRARKDLFGMADLASQDSRKEILGKMFCIDWGEWNAAFDDEELRDDLYRWYVDICCKTLMFEVDRRLCGVIQVDWSTVGKCCPEEEMATYISKKREGETSRCIVFPRLTCTDPASSGNSAGAYVLGCTEEVERLPLSAAPLARTADLWKLVLRGSV